MEQKEKVTEFIFSHSFAVQWDSFVLIKINNIGIF